MAQKERIMHAAIKLFGQNGYNATTLSQVATVVGMTQPGLYYYYSSKREILRDIIKFSDEYLEICLSRIMSLPLDPYEKLRQLINELVKINAENSALFRIQQRERRNLLKKDRDFVIDKERKIISNFENVYEQVVKSSRLKGRPCRVTVMLILGLCNSIIFWYNPNGSIKPDELAQLAWALITERILEE